MHPMNPYIQEAGAIAFRKLEGHCQVLLIRSKKDPSKRIFPKGHLEAGESVEDASKRELLEEAGVQGKIVADAGSLEFIFEGHCYKVAFFLHQFHSTLSLGEPGRDPLWCNIDEALELLSFPNSRQLLSSNAEKIIRFCD